MIGGEGRFFLLSGRRSEISSDLEGRSLAVLPKCNDNDRAENPKLLWGLFLQEQIPQVCPGRNFSWTHPVLFQSPRGPRDFLSVLVQEMPQRVHGFWTFWIPTARLAQLARCSGRIGLAEYGLHRSSRPQHHCQQKSLPGHQILVPRFSAREIWHNQKGHLLLISWEVRARFERFPS